MGIFTTLLYLVFSTLSPADLFPDVAGERILLWLAIVAVLGSLPSLLRSGVVIVSPASLLMIGFIGAICVSRASHAWFGGALMALREFLPSAILFFLVALNFNTNPAKLRLLAWVLFGVTLYIALAGTVALIANDLHSPFLLAWEDRPDRTPRLRGVGFLKDPNDFGQQMVIALALVPALFSNRNSILKNVLLIICIPSFLYCIYLTQSRGTLLGLAAVVLAYLRPKLGKTKSVALALLLLVGYGASGFALDRGGVGSVSDASSMNRLSAWSDGVAMFRKFPLFGVGYLQFRESAERAAHSSFVQCFAEEGIVGYLLWLSMIILAFKELNRLMASVSPRGPDNDLYTLALAYRTALIGFLVTGFFLSRAYVMTFYLLCGAAEALHQMYTRQQAAAAPPKIRMYRVLALSGTVQMASLMMFYVVVRLHWLFR